MLIDGYYPSPGTLYGFPILGIGTVLFIPFPHTTRSRSPKDFNRMNPRSPLGGAMVPIVPIPFYFNIFNRVPVFSRTLKGICQNVERAVFI
jgi:hypothetical protein